MTNTPTLHENGRGGTTCKEAPWLSDIGTTRRGCTKSHIQKVVDQQLDVTGAHETSGTSAFAAVDKSEPAAARYRRAVYAASEGNHAELRPITARHPPSPGRGLPLRAAPQPPTRNKGGERNAAPTTHDPRIAQHPEAKRDTFPPYRIKDAVKHRSASNLFSTHRLNSWDRTNHTRSHPIQHEPQPIHNKSSLTSVQPIANNNPPLTNIVPITEPFPPLQHYLHLAEHGHTPSTLEDTQRHLLAFQACSNEQGPHTHTCSPHGR